MKTVFNIARAELQSLFFSPVAWLIIIIFTFQCSMGYTTVVESWQTYFAQGYKSTGVSMDVFANPVTGLFSSVLNYLYLYIPLLTMGLMSREFQSGSVKLLYSSPVTNMHIILGKFLSMLIYALILIAILMVYVLFSWKVVKEFEIGAVLTGVLGIYLLICAYAAIGLFMSSLTSYQVVAAMGTLAVLAALNYVGGLWQDIEFVREITYWLAIGGRVSWFVLGMFASEDFFYFIIVMLLFLSLSIIRLNAARQKTRFAGSAGKYFAVISIALLLGYISSRPILMFFNDATSNKFNTLTPNSQEVIKKLKGPLTITTYVNMLDDQNLYIGVPRAVMADMYRFRQYTRFKPETKLKYVYYYDSIKNPGMEKRYPNMSSRERMQKIAEHYNMNEDMVIGPDEIRRQIDLAPEGKIFVRSIQRGSGEQTFLRIFDDPMVFPGESEITAALKRLSMEKLPKAGFLRGHGERDNTLEGDRNYNRFAQDKPFRYSLINQGFDVADVMLDKEVPADVNILVIADMRVSLTPAEQQYLENYIARGGNLLIAGETRRQQAMEELIAPLGVRFAKGQLVVQSKTNLPDFILSRPTADAKDLIYILGEMHKRKSVVTMPGAVGLEYSTDKGFDVAPLLMSDSLSWNETETTNFIDDTVKLNPAAGEIQKAWPTALALSRKVGNKVQKIMILGDADCISNGEISISRQNVRAANFSLISSAFFWMSDNEVPIDVRRPDSKDDEMSLDRHSMLTTKIALVWVMPGLMVMIALIGWIRRRSR
ncbi:MAG TPA: Gldg family protein [Pseudobacter sp.]|nr:Gldg family protein [Pseudobacter sp.]